jgi:hypothetical protein
MRKVRGKLCRTSKGKFTRCRGPKAAGSRRKSTRGKSCKYGVNKRTGKCLKRPRSCWK